MPLICKAKKKEAFGKQLDSNGNSINNKDPTIKKNTSSNENEVKHTTNNRNPTSSVLTIWAPPDNQHKETEGEKGSADHKAPQGYQGGLVQDLGTNNRENNSSQKEDKVETQNDASTQEPNPLQIIIPDTSLSEAPEIEDMPIEKKQHRRDTRGR